MIEFGEANNDSMMYKKIEPLEQFYLLTLLSLLLAVTDWVRRTSSSRKMDVRSLFILPVGKGIFVA